MFQIFVYIFTSPISPPLFSPEIFGIDITFKKLQNRLYEAKRLVLAYHLHIENSGGGTCVRNSFPPERLD